MFVQYFYNFQISYLKFLNYFSSNWYLCGKIGQNSEIESFLICKYISVNHQKYSRYK